MNAMKDGSFWVFSWAAFVWQEEKKQPKKQGHLFGLQTFVYKLSGPYCKAILHLSVCFTLMN